MSTVFSCFVNGNRRGELKKEGSCVIIKHEESARDTTLSDRALICGRNVRGKPAAEKPQNDQTKEAVLSEWAIWRLSKESVDKDASRECLHMVYFEKNELVIRDLCEQDIALLVDEENAQGYHASPEKYRMRLEHQAQGKSVSLVAEYRGCVAGYINVYPDSEWGAFGKQGYPEIVDFGVLEKYRRKGIGGRLMDVAEQICAQYAGMAYLGVGMHSGYGSAQRMYVKRGYLPDGSGVWYGEQVCEPYGDCKNDDNLVLYLSKKL